MPESFLLYTSQLQKLTWWQPGMMMIMMMMMMMMTTMTMTMTIMSMSMSMSMSIWDHFSFSGWETPRQRAAETRDGEESGEPNSLKIKGLDRSMFQLQVDDDASMEGVYQYYQYVAEKIGADTPLRGSRMVMPGLLLMTSWPGAEFWGAWIRCISGRLVVQPLLSMKSGETRQEVSADFRLQTAECFQRAVATSSGWGS